VINEDDDTFVNSLRGVKPIKKSNKITKPIPKPKPKPKHTTKTAVEKKDHKDNKIIATISKKTSFLEEIQIEKSPINKKLKRGKILIDKKIDFHGYSINEAKQIFLDTIDYCYNNNYRCILFITGKGVIKRTPNNFNENKLFFGKIRNSFLEWANSKKTKLKILNVQQADIKNGGDGAFFVYLRKNKN